MIEKKNIKKKHRDELQRKYKLKQTGLHTVREVIRQRMIAKRGKIQRYDNRIKQFQQNRAFANNQGKFFKVLNNEGMQQSNERPNAEETKAFWSEIWGQEVSHNKEADWVKEFRKEGENRDKQERPKVTVEKVQKKLKSFPNWKSPGPDGVQGYWLKNFNSMHKYLAEYLHRLVQGENIPMWMTKGKTVLIQKDKGKGTVSSNYRPITCLPIVWKLLTSLIADDIYHHLETKSLLPQEQRGCRKRTKGTRDLLFIDKMILKEVKNRKKSLAMCWIDYRKAYDLISHSWILECLMCFGISEEICNLLEKSMKSWCVELTCGENVLGQVNIRRGIFQGDSLSPLLFIISLTPLTMILNKTKYGYQFSTNGQRINHLLYMDDLKLYSRTEKELNSLVETVRIFSKDINMEFVIQKCALLVLKRGKSVKTEGIQLQDNSFIRSLENDENYKYRGVLQANEVNGSKMKKKMWVRNTKGESEKY